MFPVFPGQKLSPISVDNSWDKNKTVFMGNLTIFKNTDIYPSLVMLRSWYESYP